jgi:hypothetical protein
VRWFRRIFHPFHVPCCRIPLAIELWGEFPRRLGLPEAIGSVLFIWACLLLLAAACLLAAPASLVQLGLFLTLWAVIEALLICVLLSWVIRWAVRRGWMRR